MRLVTWNCKGAFARKHAVVAALRPDVLIVPECERLLGIPEAPGVPPVTSFQWFGAHPNKGLAVLSYGEYAIEPHPGEPPRHRWVIPLRVSGPVSFLLLAVWTVPKAGSRSYVQPLFEAFEQYSPLAGASEVVWAGDFNASLAFDRPSRRHKFGEFVRLLESRGLRSVYHEQRACPHGEEPEATFYQHHHADRGHHIDYIFASAGLQAFGFRVDVGAHATWARQSDHVPVACEFFEPPRKSPGIGKE
jgi:exonuclease III